MPGAAQCPPVEVGSALVVLVWDKLLEPTSISFTGGPNVQSVFTRVFLSSFQHSPVDVAIGAEPIER